MGMTVQSNECYDEDQYRMLQKHKAEAPNSVLDSQYTIKQVIQAGKRKVNDSYVTGGIQLERPAFIKIQMEQQENPYSSVVKYRASRAKGPLSKVWSSLSHTFLIYTMNSIST